MQAEVSPPLYDELLLNWNPPSLFHCQRMDKKKEFLDLDANKYLDRSGNLWESSWSYGVVIVFLKCTNSFMDAAESENFTVTWHAQLCMCASVRITCTHVYTFCNTCSMDLI